MTTLAAAETIARAYVQCQKQGDVRCFDLPIMQAAVELAKKELGAEQWEAQIRKLTKPKEAS